jgi:hypothetical protein
MTTRFLIVPVAAIAFLLIGAPYAAAVAQSPRSALMPETIAACREQALAQEKLMALMAFDLSRAPRVELAGYRRSNTGLTPLKGERKQCDVSDAR